jgi:hypothetical protein
MNVVLHGRCYYAATKDQIASEYSLTLCRSNRILLGVGAGIIVVETLELALNVGSDGPSRSLTHSMTAHLSFPASSLRAMSEPWSSCSFHAQSHQ